MNGFGEKWCSRPCRESQDKKGCTCPRTSMTLNGRWKHCFYIKNKTSICHGGECKFNYKNADFTEILSLHLDTTTKPWVGSHRFRSLEHLRGTVREGLLSQLSVTATLRQRYTYWIWVQMTSSFPSQWSLALVPMATLQGPHTVHDPLCPWPTFLNLVVAPLVTVVSPSLLSLTSPTALLSPVHSEANHSGAGRQEPLWSVSIFLDCLYMWYIKIYKDARSTPCF